MSAADEPRHAQTGSGRPDPAPGRQRDVWIVGSINLDLVLGLDRLPAPGETVLAHRLERFGGGKGANQAVAAARAGATVHLVGAVGRDDAGDAALDELAAEGIDVSSIARLEREPSGLALILLDPRGENEIVVVQGANGAMGPGHVRKALARGNAGDVCLVSLEISDEAVAAAARTARERGMRVVVNPAPARALPDAVYEARPILTPNASELLVLAGTSDPTDLRTPAVAMSIRSGSPLVVTLGASGAMIVNPAGTRTLPAFAVEPIDTVGAGDAFSGTLAASLTQNLPLDDALTRALAAGALATTVRGARASMPRADAVDRLIEASPGR